MFPTKSTREVNVAKCETIINDTNRGYSSPKIFAVGTAAELIQGQMNYSSVRDGFNSWYAWVSY